jgi:hypothetical protein
MSSWLCYIVVLLPHLVYWIVFAVFLVILAALTVAYGYLSFWAACRGWTVFVQVLAILSYWYTANVIGQAAYHVFVGLAGEQFVHLHCERGDLKTGPSTSTVWRSFYSFGIAAANGFILPVVSPAYRLAHANEYTFEHRVQIIVCLSLRSFVVSIYGRLHRFGVWLCEGLDTLWSWPSQQGAAYSVLAGMSRERGGERVAELGAWPGLWLVHLYCPVDALIGLWGLAAEAGIAVFAWALAGYLCGKEAVVSELAVKRVFAGVAFFMTYAFVNLVRKMIAAIVDATVVFYGEEAGNLVDPGLKQRIDAAWSTGVVYSSTPGGQDGWNPI